MVNLKGLSRAQHLDVGSKPFIHAPLNFDLGFEAALGALLDGPARQPIQCGISARAFDLALNAALLVDSTGKADRLQLLAQHHDVSGGWFALRRGLRLKQKKQRESHNHNGD